jgi:hypothetical protein
MDPEDIVTRLSQRVPDGIDLDGCERYARNKGAESRDRVHYSVELKDGFFSQNDLDYFFEKSHGTIERSTKKGKIVQIDLKKALTNIQIIDSKHAQMTLEMVDKRVVRPAHIMRFIFGLNDPQINTAIITKRKADYV